MTKRLMGNAGQIKIPYAINTDEAGCYGIAIKELKAEGKLPDDTEHRQVKYFNNIVKSDHGQLKRLIKPTLGFKSMKTAYATIKGFEAVRSLKKGQASAYRIRKGIRGEVRLIERCFHLGNSAIADAMEMLNHAFLNNQIKTA